MSEINKSYRARKFILGEIEKNFAMKNEECEVLKFCFRDFFMFSRCSLRTLKHLDAISSGEHAV